MGHLLQTRLESLFYSHMSQSQGSFLQHSSPPAMPEQSKYPNKTYNGGKMQEAPKSISNGKKIIFIFLTFQPPLLPLGQKLSEKYMTTSPLYLPQPNCNTLKIYLLFFLHVFNNLPCITAPLFSHGKLPQIFDISMLPKADVKFDTYHGVFPFPLLKGILKKINISQEIRMTSTKQMNGSRANV